MSQDSLIIKARGLPWSATADEVLEFFSTSNVVGGESGVHFTKSYDGRPSGVCYIEVESQDDIDAAMKRDKEKMGRRYIEVFTSTYDEMKAEMSNEKRGGSQRGGNEEDAVVRLRGLPFSASKRDVEDFFSGIDIEDNGVLMINEMNGRPKGEAFVQFKTADGARRALERTKQSMGHRYIEVFPSSMDEAVRAQTHMSFPGGPSMRGGGGPMRGGGGMMGMRPSPYDRMGGRSGGGGGYGGSVMRGGYGGGSGGGGFHPGSMMMNAMGAMGGGAGGPMGMMGGGGGGMRGGGAPCTIRMRGLPFRVTEKEIAEWFSSVADPVDIFIRYNADNRPSGDADVTFGSEGDAKRAMTKNKQNMQHRYIELFMENRY